MKNAILFIAALLVCGCRAWPLSSPSTPDEWPTYGNDSGGSRYSPLAQIDRQNVTRLRAVWTYRTGEPAGTGSASEKAFEATPLMVEGTLFFSTPYNRVIALDAETGAERWSYDPKVDRGRRIALAISRGVSTWLDDAAPAGRACRRRIFLGTIDARLIALDAATGVPCAEFGRGGAVDLSTGINVSDARCCYQVTSPPAVAGLIVVVGSAIGDNRAVDAERGVVRGFDARTGSGRGERTTVRALLFLPTSSPSPDFYGGERLGANVYANSVLALRAATGEVVWHFQVVHHDLWDYDVPAQPSLLAVSRAARGIT